jgi:hypothetical protein
VYHYDRPSNSGRYEGFSPSVVRVGVRQEERDTREYVALLEKALAVDIDASPENSS